MAGLSNSLRESVLNWLLFGTAFPAAPATLYIALHSDDPGLAGANELAAANGYARVAVAVGATNWNALINSGADELGGNKTDITFGPASGADWVEAKFFGIWSALTGGTFYIGGSCTNQIVKNGETASFKGNTDSTLSGLRVKGR